jgi:hypothetical protein
MWKRQARYVDHRSVLTSLSNSVSEREFSRSAICRKEESGDTQVLLLRPIARRAHMEMRDLENE